MFILFLNYFGILVEDAEVSKNFFLYRLLLLYSLSAYLRLITYYVCSTRSRLTYLNSLSKRIQLLACQLFLGCQMQCLLQVKYLTIREQRPTSQSISRPSSPRSWSSLIAVCVNYFRPLAMLASYVKFVEYVQPPIDSRTFRFQFHFFRRQSCLIQLQTLLLVSYYKLVA